MTDKMPFILYSVPNHIMPPDWSGDWLIPYIRMAEPIGHQLPPMHPIEEASLKIHRTITPMGFFIFTCVSWPSELTREQAIDYLKNYLKNSK